MSLEELARPAVLPVNISEVKEHLYIGQDETDWDVTLNGYMQAAVAKVEKITDRALITRTSRLWLDIWPRDCIEFPKPNLLQVDSVKYQDINDTETLLSATDYEVQTKRAPGLLAMRPGKSWPALYEGGRYTRIKIDFKHGYGATQSDVPAPVRHAILMLVAHYFQEKQPVGLAQAAEIPMTIRDSLANFRFRTL